MIYAPPLKEELPRWLAKSRLLGDSSLRPAQPTRGERVIQFIERYCRVPEGKLVGQPIRLEWFQRLFILAVYDNPDGTAVAILSIARKNGKTALIAALVLCHLVGPEARLNSQIVSGARSRDQAALVFKLALKMVDLNPHLRKIIRDVPSSKTLIGLPMNVEYRALSAEGGSNHGLSPVLAIIDEMGQVKGDQDDFIEAIETAQGAYDDALEIIISTQARSDADMLSIRIDDAIRSDDPHTVCHLYSADSLAQERDIKQEEVQVTDPDAQSVANPALGSFRSEVELARMAQRADRMPSFENSYRNLNLNQRVNRIETFVSASIWALGNRQVDEDAIRRSTRIYGGLDLAETTDLVSFVYGAEVPRPDEDVLDWHLKALFWKAEVTLEEHEKRDRVPYSRWVKEGYLKISPGIAVDYEFVARDIAEELDGLDIAGIAYDRHRFKNLQKKFSDMEPPVELPFVEWGQGYVSMAPAMDAAEIEFLNGRIAHGGNPILRWNASNAVVVRDTAGNRKLDKSKSTGRIDGMQSTVMLLGLASQGGEPDGPSVYEKRGVFTL